MNRSFLQRHAFIDPRGGNREEIERLMSRAVALLLPYLTQAVQRPPLPDVYVPEQPIPAVPLGEDELIEELRRLISGSMNPAHPGYMGHMSSMPTTMSIIGDLIVSAVSNNMLFQEISPLCTPLELMLMKQFARLFGLGEGSGGVLNGSGSMSNLQALVVARNAKFGTREKGLRSLQKSPTILASEVSHASVRKAGMVMGLGASDVVSVPVDGNSRMRTELLRERIKEERAAGREPFCVVATAGTTITGNIDPLVEAGHIAHEFGLWYHVDAAYGGALIFSEKYKNRLAGIDMADSITFNPQKWLYVSNGCSMALFKDMKGMKDAFRIASPYTGGTGYVTNLGEITVHGSRRVEVVKLWLSLQHIGSLGYGRLVEEGCHLADYLRKGLEQRSFLEIVGESDTNLVCFRATPTQVESAKWDAWNEDLQAFLLREGEFFLSFPPYRGVRWLRTALLNPYADEQFVDHLLESIDSFTANRRRASIK